MQRLSYQSNTNRRLGRVSLAAFPVARFCQFVKKQYSYVMLEGVVTEN